MHIGPTTNDLQLRSGFDSLRFSRFNISHGERGVADQDHDHKRREGIHWLLPSKAWSCDRDDAERDKSQVGRWLTG